MIINIDAIWQETRLNCLSEKAMDTTHLLLDADESIVSEIQPHWFFYRHAMLSVFLCIGLIILTAVTNIFGGLVLLGWSLKHTLISALMLVAFFSVIDSYLNYHAACYVLTNKRLIICSGWLLKSTRDILLSRIEGVQISQRIMGRIFGFGTIFVYGVGTTVDVMPSVPDPYAFRALLNQKISQGNQAR